MLAVRAPGRVAPAPVQPLPRQGLRVPRVLLQPRLRDGSMDGSDSRWLGALLGLLGLCLAFRVWWDIWVLYRAWRARGRIWRRLEPLMNQQAARNSLANHRRRLLEAPAPSVDPQQDLESEPELVACRVREQGVGVRDDDR